jgi:uncharacterized membrane protein
MTTPLQHFVVWLEQTSLSQTIQIVPWIIPLVQTIHILAIAAVIGSMGFLDLRVLGLAARSQSLASVRDRLLPWMWRALIVLLLSGIVMVIGEPGRSLVNPIFQLKMTLVVIAATTTIFFARTLRSVGGQDEHQSAPVSAKLTAIVSLALWISIVFAGRWIAYGDTVFDYGAAQ